MDETQFQQTLENVHDNPCPFAKAIFRGCCSCSRARKLLIAEREFFACISPGAQQRCATLLPELRKKAAFVLRSPHPGQGILPHGKEIQIQCGALLGIAMTLKNETTAPDNVADIFMLLESAERHYKDLEQLPYAALMPVIAHFQNRPGRVR
ncbi:MAG: hypothetical protein HQL49_05050 [Gammaproteobacteria bacterium]|nr:hypothetical protein [Gammaproteobacteria bacterium]